MHANCTCQSACLPELSAASPSIPAHTQKQHTPDSPLLGWGVEVLGHGAQRGGSDVHQAGQHLQNHAAHRETGKRAHVGWQGCEFQRQSVSASCAHMLNVVGVCGLSSCTPSRPLPCTPSRHPPTRFLRPPAAAGGGVHSWRHAQHPALEQRRAGSCPPLGVEGGAGPLQLRPAGSTAVGGGAGNTRLAAQPGSRRTAAFNALSGTFRACASSVGGQANEGGPADSQPNSPPTQSAIHPSTHPATPPTHLRCAAGPCRSSAAPARSRARLCTHRYAQSQAETWRRTVSGRGRGDKGSAASLHRAIQCCQRPTACRAQQKRTHVQ